VLRCLLRLRERAEAHTELDGEGPALWMDYELEALRFGVEPDVSREELAALVEGSTVVLSYEEHRNGDASGLRGSPTQTTRPTGGEARRSKTDRGLVPRAYARQWGCLSQRCYRSCAPQCAMRPMCPAARSGNNNPGVARRCPTLPLH
jgi:hypothetical protein